MAERHVVADDIVYNLISIQYHALQGAETEDVTSAAWEEARRFGYIESAGLLMDQLTPAGRARAADFGRATGGEV